MPKDIRPFSREEYAIIVLQGFKRMVRRTDYYLGFIQPRSVLDDQASSTQVVAAIEHAIEVLREKLVMESESQK